MYKRIFVIVFIGLLTFTSCSNNTLNNEEVNEVIEDEKVIAEDYDSVFDFILMKEEIKSNYQLKRYDIDCEILGFNSKQQIICRKGRSIAIYDLEEEKLQKLVEEGWNVILSHDNSKLLYQDNLGIHCIDFGTMKTIDLFNLDSNTMIRNYIWSNNDEKVFVQSVNKLENKNYIINLKTKDIIETNIDETHNFTIKELIYYNNNILYVIAETNVQFSDSNIERVTNFYKLDLERQKITKLTDLNVGDFLYFIQQINSSELAFIIENNIFQEEGRISNSKFKIFNVNKNKFYNSNIKTNNFHTIIFSKEKDLFYLIENYNDNFYSDKKVLKFYDNGKVIDILEIEKHSPSDIFLTKDNNSIIFYSNGSIYKLDKF